MDLFENENIILDTEICKITNLRIITGKTSATNIFKQKKSVEFDDINSFEMIMNHGEENKIKTGLKYFLSGLIILFIVSIIPVLGEYQTIQSILFLIGVIPLIYGGYLTPKSLFRLKEHSTIFLWLQNGKCIIISFPQFDNDNAKKIQFKLSEMGVSLVSKK